MRAAIVSLFAAVELVSAHFEVVHPPWRADSLAENTTYSQWNYPCTFLILFLYAHNGPVSTL